MSPQTAVQPRRLIDMANAIYVYGRAIAELLKTYTLENATNGRLVQSFMVRRAYTGISGPIYLDELGEKIDDFIVTYMDVNDDLQRVLNIQLNVTCWTCNKVQYNYVS